MKPIEFEEKYKCYAYGDHPAYTGKEIRDDVEAILSETTGFAIEYDDGTIGTGDGLSSFTRRSIEGFKKEFLQGSLRLLDDRRYYLDFVGMHEDILIARRPDKN